MTTFGKKTLATGAIAVLGTIGVAAGASPAHAVAQSPSQVAATHETTVRYGMKGAAVRLAQQKLDQRGAHLVVDGLFGPKTLAAVKSFQRAQRIAADGIVGPITWSRLDHPRSSAAPTLGLAGWGGRYDHTRGFGQVRPGLFDNGGDPTGLVTNVVWANWGGKTASATGKGTYVPPNVPIARGFTLRADIRAYDLGTCNGHPAYRHVTWWFPSKGETYQSARNKHVEDYNLCTAG